MNILLTGASGFLGQVCSVKLKEAGHRVVGTDRQGTPDILGDLSDPSFVQSLPPTDWVVHAAAVQYVSQDLPILNRGRWFETHNVLAVQNLCNRYAGQVKFLNIGTSMMYRQGVNSALTTESPMQGQGVYSRSKLLAQRLIEKHFESWATVIPCIIGGPGRGGLFTGFVKSISRRGLVFIPGPGNHPTHMIHVNDVAGLVAKVVARDGRGFFNAAAPQPLSITQWVREIAMELNVPHVRILHLPLLPIAAAAAASGYTLLAREQVLMLSYPHVLDTDRSTALGWMAEHTNAQIVRDTARAIAAQNQQS